MVTCQPAHQLLVGRALCSSWAALGWFPLGERVCRDGHLLVTASWPTWLHQCAREVMGWPDQSPEGWCYLTFGWQKTGPSAVE